MKKLLAVLVFGLIAFSLHAQPTVGAPTFDPFNYTVGSNLIGQVSPQGFTWFQAGSSAAAQPVVTAGPLTYPGLLPVTGQAVSYGGPVTGYSARLDLGSTFTGSSAAGQTFYYSLAFKITAMDSLPTGGSFVCGFNNAVSSGSAPTVFGAELTVRSNGVSTYNLGITKAGSAGANSAYGGTPFVASVGTTYFVVLSYTFSSPWTSNGDSVSIWIDPPASTFGAASAPTPYATTTTGADIQTNNAAADAIESFVFRVNNASEPTVNVGELSVGLSWADVTPAQTQPAYFDPGNSQSGTGSGGNGTWDNAGMSDWYNGTAGPDVLWNSFPGTTNVAYFGGTGGAVSVPGSVAADGLTFAVDGYNLSGSGTITLQSLPYLNVASGTATIGCILAGTDGYQKSGPGNLTLTNTANSISGSAIISGGTLEVSNSGCLGSGLTTVFLASGATLQNDDPSTIDNVVSNTGPVQIVLTGSDATATIDISSPSGLLTYSSTSTANITGSKGGFTKTGPGTLWISGNANTYGGPTIINQGAVSIGGDRSTVTAANLGEVPSSYTSNNIILGGGTLSANNTANLHTNRGILLTANSTLDVTTRFVNQVLTVNGNITQTGGSFGITKTSGGVLTLTGTNTYTGNTIISAGELALSTTGSLSSSSSISIAGAAIFDVSTLASSTYILGNGATLSASGAGTTTNTGGAVINGASGGTINLGSQPISLTFTPTAFTGDTAHPSLYISQGALTLSGNTIAVNNAAASPLGAGTYTLIQVAGGTINGTPNSSVSVTGSGLAASATASLSVTNGNVNLVVTGGSLSTPTITTVGLSGTTLTIMATNGTPGAHYVLLESTNVALPLTNWTSLLTNTFDVNGKASIMTGVANPSDKQEFFILHSP